MSKKIWRFDPSTVEGQKPKGECHMRTVFVLLFAVFIGAGFLLADNIHIRQDFNFVKQQNIQLSQENENLKIERDTAIANLAESNQKIVELTQKSQAQEEQIRKLREENVGLKDQIAGMQKKIDTLQVFDYFRSSLPKAMSLAIFLPIIPASMAATYVLVRYNKNHQRKDTTMKSQRNILVQLTDSEIKEIIRTRRNK